MFLQQCLIRGKHLICFEYMDGFEISAPAAFVVVRAQLKVVGQGSRREADVFACKNKTQKSFK